MAIATKKNVPASTAKTDAAGRRVKKAGEPALASYVDKRITPVITDYVEWLKAETGYEVDPMSVQLSSALRGRFQKSEGNQQRMAARAAEIEQERLDREAARVERAQRKADREAARAEKAAAPKAEKVVKAPATKAAAKATPAKASRRRPAAAATDEDFS